MPIDENDPNVVLLRVIFAFKPWGRDRFSRQVAKYLDGDLHALDSVPTMRKILDDAIEGVKGNGWMERLHACSGEKGEIA